METAVIFRIIDRILDLIDYFVGEKQKQEREETNDQIKNDPVGYFNDRYSSGVQRSGSDAANTDTDDKQT